MKQDNSYELRFSNLKVGVHTYDWKIDRTFLEERGVEDFSSVDLQVDLELQRKERLMDLHFSIVGKVKTACDRCGEDVDVPFDSENHLVIRLAHETDLTDDEVVFVDENEQTIDLGQFIYEFIVVGLPSRFIHPEGQCDPKVEQYLEEASDEGEESKEEKEIDPRWEALKNLKHKN